MQYTAKPITVDAVQWTCTNEDEIKLFLNDPSGECIYQNNVHVMVPQLGVRAAGPLDWILKDSMGALSVCPEALFAETYDVVELPPPEEDATKSLHSAKPVKAVEAAKPVDTSKK